MSELERIRAAAAHPENWQIIKAFVPPSEQAACVLLSLMTSWPNLQEPQRQSSRLHSKSPTR